MAKTEKELQELKNKVEEVNNELKELSEEELNQVAGGLPQLQHSFKTRFDKDTCRIISAGH